jgi:hypothetical protein
MGYTQFATTFSPFITNLEHGSYNSISIAIRRITLRNSGGSRSDSTHPFSSDHRISLGGQECQRKPDGRSSWIL